MVDWLGKEGAKSALTQRVGPIDQIADIKLMQSPDDQGTGALGVKTGSGLSFQVIADRALDISQCNYRGTPLAWHAPNGDNHASYYEQAEAGWLRSFRGGLTVTCGLDQFGEPNIDQGDRLGLHGRISHTPANQLSYRSFWDADEYVLEISGQMRQQRLIGENLLLSRRINTSLGSRCIRLEDSVTDKGYEHQPHMLLYHCSFGFPLINEDTRLTMDTSESIGCDQRTSDELNQQQDFQAPVKDYLERVYRHQPLANASGSAVIQLQNPTIGTCSRLSYDKASLSYLYQSKVMAQGVYVTGLESANCGVTQDRSDARNKGQLPLLDPGETCHYHLDFEVVEKAGELVRVMRFNYSADRARRFCSDGNGGVLFIPKRVN